MGEQGDTEEALEMFRLALELPTVEAYINLGADSSFDWSLGTNNFDRAPATLICTDSPTSSHGEAYRGASLIRERAPLGPFSRTMPRAIWWSYGGGGF